LVPQQYTTGGKPRLGGIGKKASYYLRRQLSHGARALLLTLARRNDRLVKWAQELLARAGHNKTAVAMANKTVRMAWAMLRTRKDFKWLDWNRRPSSDNRRGEKLMAQRQAPPLHSLQGTMAIIGRSS